MQIETPAQLGRLVRDQRLKLDLSQAQLAVRVSGVTRQWVISLEGGSANPDLQTTLRLLKALDLSMKVGTGDTARLSVGSPDLDDVLRAAKRSEP